MCSIGKRRDQPLVYLHAMREFWEVGHCKHPNFSQSYSTPVLVDIRMMGVDELPVLCVAPMANVTCHGFNRGKRTVLVTASKRSS